jgi:hypothetical protein
MDISENSKSVIQKEERGKMRREDQEKSCVQNATLSCMLEPCMLEPSCLALL